MSRNFEKEYRDFMVDEVPDLWSRIEGNLKEKEIVSGYTKTEIETIKKAKDKKIASIYVKKYAVAACLCLVILAGGVVAVYKGKVPSRKIEMMAIDHATENASDWDLAEDAAPMEEVMDGAEMKEAEMEETEMMESETLSDELSEKSSFDNVANQMVVREERVESNKNQTNGLETTEDATSELNDNVQLDVEETEQVSEDASESLAGSVQAVVKITSIENTGEEILYYAQVLPSVYSEVEPGTEIVFCMGDLVVSEPKMGWDYKVCIGQPMESELTETGIIYMLKQIELQDE